MLIRKISIGSDYKDSAMHYVVGQDVLNGNYRIHHIRQNDDRSILIWIEKEKEIYLWKHFRETMPISIESNLNF